MIKKNASLSCVYSAVLCLVFISTTHLSASAQHKHKKVHVKKQLQTKIANKEDIDCNNIEANIIFPDLLSGNEEESLDYIEKFSTNRRAYLIRTYNRGKNYFPKAVSILNKHHLPEEFKILLALESAFNANAVSKAGAVGYWQIMDEVAKEYGLKYAPHLSAAEKKKKEKELKKSIAKKENKKTKKLIIKDDRKDFVKSTHAAARYLKDRSRNLNNDPLLVVASYNCGVGNVWEAMEKTGKNNPTFWDVKKYLPAETRSYVMNFITLNVIFKNYEKFASNTLTFKPVKVKTDDADETIDEATTSLNNK
jgi:membrane-bound lytic murein transglycosylase D